MTSGKCVFLAQTLSHVSIIRCDAMPPARLSLRRRTAAVTTAHVAQSVEHLHGKEKVIGSIPIVGSNLVSLREAGVFLFVSGNIYLPERS